MIVQLTLESDLQLYFTYINLKYINESQIDGQSWAACDVMLIV